jgi:hypothetical protein
VELGIPFATGVLAFLAGPVLFIVVNVNLFLQIKFKEVGAIVWLAFLFMFANVALDLLVGYKQAIVLQCVILACYYFVLRDQMTPGSRKRLLILLLAFSALAFSVYNYVNYYRFAVLSGVGFASAVATAAVGASASNSSTVVEVVNRINGVDNFFAALSMSKGMSFSYQALYADELVRAFVGENLGDDSIATSFGLTQFGALYAVGGLPLLIVGGFALGYVMRFVARIAFRDVIRSEVIALAYAPILALFFIRVLFAGGELFLFAKELFVSLFVLYVLSRFLSSGVASRST